MSSRQNIYGVRIPENQNYRRSNQLLNIAMSGHESEIRVADLISAF
jgi:hypothetical protein